METHNNHPRAQPMVRWYDPGQLITTAQQVAVSTLFGRYSDPRLVESFAAADLKVYDYRHDENGKERDEIWIDYVSDTGDGWDSTYAVAYYATEPTLSFRNQKQGGDPIKTRPGHILIFGGDEVYPTPSRTEYQNRLIFPYEMACRHTPAPHPEVFAIPGNHDWYDGLIAFRRLFLSQRWFGGWQTRQTRSYFALRLPGCWWLIGTDVQLGSDIDDPQVGYFESVAKEMGNDDRIILCNAEPHWIYAHIYEEYDSSVYNESNLEFLEKKVFRRPIDIFIAGDLHHYRRHEAISEGAPRQKITAGGGGAFLHPTHGPDVSSIGDNFVLKKSYPGIRESRRLGWKNLLFLILNWRFGSLTAICYLVTGWLTLAPLSSFGIHQFLKAVYITLRTVIVQPLAALWIVLVLAGFYFFTDTHSPTYKKVAGWTHGLAHLTSVFFLGWMAGYIAWKCFGHHAIYSLTLAGLILFIGGWIIGPIIMGLYLAISLNIFDRHQNEAFSSLASPDWKNFVRFRIDKSGSLAIYPIGIRRVPRKWKYDARLERAEPNDPRASGAELVEPPIVI
ncbi:MAG TPA: metallophosphoesterase [Chthoniobacterales bacterium]|nr:metallophosphoesterase [Chthoniobacterales bacterium]